MITTTTIRPMIPIFARGLRLGSELDSRTCRRIHTTPWVSKSVKEKISEVADKVNKKVDEGLATAIETSEKATGKTKKTLGTTAKHAKSKDKGVKEGTDRMRQKAKEAGNSVGTGSKETRKQQRDL